ncbi:MAG: SDR family NAD(P)-dependent oxidoreductase [Pseudomonadota bacterium]
MTSWRGVCAVVGVGPGIGAATVRRFAAEGYRVALLARRSEYIEDLAAEFPDCGARAYPCDAGDPETIAAAFASIASDMGSVDVLSYNAGGGTWGTIEQIDATAFEASWRVNALGLLAAAQAVAPMMQVNGKGAIVVTGATASVRGGAKATAFASAKAAQRSLAQSLARHLWPKGVHVSLVIVDGVVDLARTRAAMPDKGDDFFLAPEDVAETIWWLAHQPKSAWSFEVEARPFGERW